MQRRENFGVCSQRGERIRSGDYAFVWERQAVWRGFREYSGPEILRDVGNSKMNLHGNRKGMGIMNIALILSGGIGTRMGVEIPKQYIEVGGRPVISYCMESLFQHYEIDAVQIVADHDWQNWILKWILGEGDGKQFFDSGRKKKFKGFSAPGENRQLSILHGLEDIKKYAVDTDYVMIHDAARPCLSQELIGFCLKAAGGHDGAIPVLPMKDTVYSSTDGQRISSLLERNELFAGQAPEVFVLGKYLEANESLLPDRILQINGSTEPAVMAGMDIAMIPGEEKNFKITTQADLERFCRIIERGIDR